MRISDLHNVFNDVTYSLLLLQKCDLIYCTFYKGKMPKIGPKINKIKIWPKSGLKVIIS